VIQSHPVDVANVVTSFILVLLVTYYLWATTWVEPLSWTWRLPGILLFCGIGCWLTGRIAMRRYQRQQSAIYYSNKLSAE
jgi:multisubunit Na+/H+ antiporter MnhB subunit